MNQAFETLGYLWPLLLVGLIIIGLLVIADAWWQRTHHDDNDPVGDPYWEWDTQPAPRHRGPYRPEDYNPEEDK